jgi:hypothetical protein
VIEYVKAWFNTLNVRKPRHEEIAIMYGERPLWWSFFRIIPLLKITGIEGNLLRIKNVSAEILIGENYKARLMELIRNKMIQ